MASEAPDRRACILGVTPELVQGPWPAGTDIHAFDRSADMIERLWERHPTCPSQVRQAQWHQLPAEDGAFRVVMADASPNQCPDREYYDLFYREVRRILNPQGAFVARYFLRPDERGSLKEIRSDVNEGRVKNFGTLKWRIAMTLTDPLSMRVRLGDIAEAFDQLFPDRASLAAKGGWRAVEIDTIERYRNKSESYTFPTLAQIGEIFASMFRISNLDFGTYELSECCPILTLRPI
ncbi:MAG: class I SAM-dependent methyltransferase [Schleiferiaceae bacterium]